MRLARYLIAFIIISSFMILFPVVIRGDTTEEYFEYTYDIELSKTIVRVNEQFMAHVKSQGTCKEDLPVTIKTADIFWKVVARDRLNNTEIPLNPRFQMTLEDLPAEVGDTFTEDFDIPLCFPADSQPSVYDIVAQTTDARLKVWFFWIDGLSYVPAEPLEIGSVECTELSENSPENSPAVTNGPGVSSSPGISSSPNVSNGPGVSNGRPENLSTNGNISLPQIWRRIMMLTNLRHQLSSPNSFT